MAYVSDDYTPNAKSREILTRAWEHVQSIPYQATARWLFYRLLQDGFFGNKKDYHRIFLSMMSRVRHNQWGPWRPDSLVDDRHEAIERGGGFETPTEWVHAVQTQLGCKLSHWHDQENYVELWFEADAMNRQFKCYTDGITLCPFGGMPSIPYKYEIAQRLERASEEYGHGIKILYFGDLDQGGMTIPKTSVADIRGWCGVDFDFIRIGINPGDEVKYNIPENFDHPGSYQWEALDDDAAKELITSAVAEHVNLDIVAEVAARAETVTTDFREYASRFVLAEDNDND